MDLYDVAIIGSGPAGLTAGIYTSRGNLKTLILAGTKWGGQLMLTSTVENFPGFPEGIQGPELMERMKKQAETFGAKIILENAVSVLPVASNYELRTTNSSYVTRAVIVATGADTVWLGLPNEQRLIGKGVSSCAPCDAFFFKNKKVAVVGGGDSACEEALFLTKFATEVTIIHRRDALRASKIMQDRVKSNPKIKFLFNTEVIDVLGQDHVEGLTLKNLEPGPYNLATDGLFVAIGHKPNSGIFENVAELDEKGYALKPKFPGIFIAGDIADHTYKQAVTAAAFGCQAAMDAEKWLEDNSK
ncbi:thioredoxin-disulfide reductase [Candidatus Gottesmanbacteria bacterium RIFCSPHIGHO2_01_FULL_42_12]|uniref:Thioredoxin reductase n=1 Tax=Candidatus Gottesmanbacteria bacterium RIFCSPHIGHO2_01_FULL_42_12 TaxID=1798377 RepID=A0A1F5Z474_9BACT|nr:MAG: thioredoxin-disulfide reductase [Candidatus Gottesmanbacteria bacterium RIFCSPHIGHO2_01_FULL_42_12]